MNYYNEIKEQIINNEITKKVKDYSKNKSDLSTYYHVGRLLAEAGKHYGESIIKEYSNRLSNELDTKYDVSYLHKIRKFYHLIEKMATVSPQLSYSHYVELLPYDDMNKVAYYIKIVEEQNLSIRELRQRLKNNEYERLPDETKRMLTTKESLDVKDFIKNPVIIHNKNHYEIISEKILQKLILEDMEHFLEELGNQFCFIKSEYKIKLGNSYNYIDLLLYNIEFNCYVVIELKITELKKEHIGQIQVYMNYIDNHLRKVNQDKTIGIIICKKDNKYIMEYCSDDRILTKEYELLSR